MFGLFSKKDFANANWFIAEKMVALLVAIFIIPKIYTELGITDIGKLNFSKSLVAMFSPVFFLGLSAISIRELIFNPHKKHQILATAFYLRLLSSFSMILLLLGYVWLTKDSEISIIMILLGLGYFIKTTDVLEYYIHAKKNSKYIFFAKTTSLLLLLGMQYYGIQQHYNVYYFAILIGLDFLIQGFIYAFILFGSKQLVLKKWHFSKDTAIHLLQSSLPLILSNFILFFYIGIDELFIKYYLGDAANGLFGTVQFLVITLTWNIGFAFIFALYPALAEAFKTDKELYYKRIKSISIFVIYFGIAIGLFYTFFGEIVLAYFYDTTFLAAKTPLKIFSWAPLFVFLGVIYEKHLVNTNQLQKDVYRFVLGSVVNVVLCYFLIPLYHIVGAAIAVLISHIVSNLVYLFIDKESRLFVYRVIRTKLA